MQLYTDYLVAVYFNGEVRKLSFSSEHIPRHSDVRFIIHCEYIRSSGSGKTAYYCNKLFDNSNNRIDDNIFNWEGIKCHLHEEETWGDVKNVWVPLTVDIWDRMEIMKTKKFENVMHDGSGFKFLFSYLNDLKLLQTHSALDITNELLAEKDKVIESLMVKSLINELIMKFPHDKVFTFSDLAKDIQIESNILKSVEIFLKKEDLIKATSFEMDNSYIKFSYSLTDRGFLLTKLGSYEAYMKYVESRM
jgi:hypothetical protein